MEELEENLAALASLRLSPMRTADVDDAWFPFALTLEKALQSGDSPDRLLEHGSPLRDELKRLLREAAESPEVAPVIRTQHDADSRELRSLCKARDEARRERDLLKVDVAALEASVGHLSRLVDDLRPGHDRYQWLRNRSLDAINEGGVFAGMVPENVVLNGEDLDRAIDADF